MNISGITPPIMGNGAKFLEFYFDTPPKNKMESQLVVGRDIGDIWYDGEYIWANGEKRK